MGIALISLTQDEKAEKIESLMLKPLNPAFATSATPGTCEKVAVLAHRLANGLPLWNAADAQDMPHESQIDAESLTLPDPDADDSDCSLSEMD